jgi:hypothetical protein
VFHVFAATINPQLFPSVTSHCVTRPLTAFVCELIDRPGKPTCNIEKYEAAALCFHQLSRPPQPTSPALSGSCGVTTLNTATTTAGAKTAATPRMPSRTSLTRQADALLSCATFKVRVDHIGLSVHVFNHALSGVGDLYTDPQIHTIDGRGMGLGNNGSKGIQRWVASHRCNAICRQLKLPQVGADAKPGMNAIAWAAAMVLIVFQICSAR